MKPTESNAIIPQPTALSDNSPQSDLEDYEKISWSLPLEDG
jgi:hypothetical protein